MPTSARLRGFRFVGFSAPAGETPSGGLFFPLVRKEEEERHAKGKCFLQSRPSLWNPFLRRLFTRRALRCRARCLAPLGPRNRGAVGNVGGRPAWRIGLLKRRNNPTCHSERSEESCRKLALDPSSLSLLRMTGGAAGSAASDIPLRTALRASSGARRRARASVWRADIAIYGG